MFGVSDSKLQQSVLEIYVIAKKKKTHIVQINVFVLEDS